MKFLLMVNKHPIHRKIFYEWMKVNGPIAKKYVPDKYG